jgi:protein-S-isoprenylcysteine O-methyltransferase Ste14
LEEATIGETFPGDRASRVENKSLAMLKADEELSEGAVMQVADSETRVESELVGQMTKWLIAAAIACVALMGLIALLAAMVFVFEPPSWAGVVIGATLAVGAVAFAWLVASALESSRRNAAETDRHNDRVTTLRPRSR